MTTELIKFAEDQRKKAADDTEKALDHKKEDTRSKATLLIVQLYVVCIAVIVTTSTILVINGSPLDGIKIINDIVTATLLPVVTFVLGFYAGKR